MAPQMVQTIGIQYKNMSLIIKKNTTFKIPRTGITQTFLPSSLGGLSLWLKADAGVTTVVEQFISQVIISGGGRSAMNGTYTRGNGGIETEFVKIGDPNFTIYWYNDRWVIEGTGFYCDALDSNTGFYAYNPSYDMSANWVISEHYGCDGTPPTGSITISQTGNILVTEWADQSGNGFVLTKDIQNEPTYLSSFVNGKPAIEFIVGDNTGLSNTSFGLTGFTFFSVTKQKPTNTGRIFSSYFGNVLIGTWGNYSNRFYGGGGNGWLAEGTQTSTDFLITTAFSDANTSFGFYQNGILQSNGNSNSTVILNGISIGGGIWNGGNEEASDSYVCEIVIYNRTLTLTERQQVETYLNQKYQIY